MDKAPYGEGDGIPCGVCREFFMQLNEKNEERNPLTVNGKPVIIGNGNIFCAASMFFTIVPVFMIAGATTGF